MRSQRRILVVYQAIGGSSSPQRLSLQTDGRGWFTIGNDGGRDMPIVGAESWKRVTEEIGRACGLSGETDHLTLVSLDRPLLAFKCVQDLLDVVDGPTVRIALKQRAPLAEKRARDVKRGKKREIELRRAREGLARVSGLLDAREREKSSCSNSTRRTGSCQDDIHDMDSLCMSSDAKVVGSNFRAEQSVATTATITVPTFASSSPKRQKSSSILTSTEPDRLTRARAGGVLPTSVLPDAPANVVVSGAFGNGVYVLWIPVRLDSGDCNNGFKVLGYKVFLNGQLEALVEGPFVSHVVLFEVEPARDNEIVVRTRCKTIDSEPSVPVKYRSDCPSVGGNALPRRLVEALNKLTNTGGGGGGVSSITTARLGAETLAVDAVDIDKQSSVTSSSGIETDDDGGGGENHRMPTFSAPPSPVRTPGATCPPDSPLDVKLTEDADSLLVEWKPVELDAKGLNNGHRILGYKIYANGKLMTRARGPKASSACLQISQFPVSLNPLALAVKTQAIYLDSKPSNKCLFAKARFLSRKSLSSSRDSIYSSDADRSRHASEAGKIAAARPFQMNKDDSGIFEQLQGPGDSSQIATFTSTAMARLPSNQKAEKTRACIETAL